MKIKTKNTLLLIVLFTFVSSLGISIYFNTLTHIETKINNTNSPVYELTYSDDYLAKNIYNTYTSKKASQTIESLKTQNQYTIDQPLMIYNPYRTNNNSLYIYFTTSSNVSVKYTIHVEDETIPDYSNTLSSQVSKIHEYNIIGLVQGQVNDITLDFYNQHGSKIASQTFTYQVANQQGQEETVLKSDTGTSSSSLDNGLYTILGNDSDDQDFVYMYDNNGILRCEIPIIGYRAHTILFDQQTMYYSISQHRIAKVNSFGQVIDVYHTGDYYLHHDYCFDDGGNLLVLAGNDNDEYDEDCLIKIDVKTKEVSEVLDMKDILESYMETATYWNNSHRDAGEDGLDWLHLNSLELVGDDIILSSRETSSIIKIKDIMTNPTLDYIIGDASFWQDSEFSQYLYQKVGDFVSQGGQHSVHYSASDQDGVYYLSFFNNNYGKANSQPDFDFSSIGLNNDNAITGTQSYYYVYKVDENKKTYELTESIAVPYSGIVSSVQKTDNGNLIIDSGTQGIFSEYDENHQLIKTFTMKLNKYMIYRVQKYSFVNFWFE